MKLYKYVFQHTTVYVVAKNEQTARRLAKQDARWSGNVEVKSMERVADKVVIEEAQL